jgi:hypothetical protein
VEFLDNSNLKETEIHHILKSSEQIHDCHLGNNANHTLIFFLFVFKYFASAKEAALSFDVSVSEYP